MSMQQTIETKITQGLHPLHLEVLDESPMHNVPAGSESHFKLVVVTESFAGKSLLARHRLVNGLLAAELQGSLHALSIHTLTPEEWFDKGGSVPESPPCLGGSAKTE
jgi:BolA protein